MLRTLENGVNTYLLGTVALLASAFLAAISQVFYAQQVQSISPFSFTFISFFLTALFFLLLSLSQKNEEKRSLDFFSFKDFALLNVSTALAFLGFYYALKYIEPAIVSALEMGVGPLFALFISTMLYPKTTILKSDALIAVGTLCASFILVGAAVTGRSGVSFDYTFEYFIGLAASLGCGMGAVLAAIYSKKLSEKAWTSSQILAHRFYLIVILSFFIAVFQKDVNRELVGHLDWILIVSVTGVLLPLYFLQVGIKHCDTFYVMMSITFVPVFTFFFQLLDPRVGWSTPTFIGILLLTVLGVISTYVKNNQDEK
ncbi:EamA family transporter [Salsuginibacillus kocurii]|uniref:EamA family transporter n=1 Tax=Salsuginibacillus kocurii TaxID=427078 RepID=UPI0003637133|nr:EamA family transporter [Salsuginibacillus kocurii]